MVDQPKVKAPAAAKAPVDDKAKRIAALEAGVAALSVALAANGVELKGGEDPIEQAIAIVKRWRELTVGRSELILAVAIAVGVEPETITDPFAGAGAALESMKERIVTLEAQGDGGAELRKRIAVLELENAELNQDVEDLANAKNELANRLAAQGKPSAAELPDEPEPEPEPEVVRVRPESARDVGPAYSTRDGAEIQLALDAGARFELVFSNGEFEIVDFSSPALFVGAKELQRLDPRRVFLKDGVEIKGSQATERVHGVGLLLEGEQVAYHKLDPEIVVHPNTHWRLAPVFG